MSKLWEIKISAILGWYSWNCPSAVGCFGWADGAPAWGTLWACKILDWPRTCAYDRPKMWVNYERFGFQPFWADTADIVQVLLVAWVELMLHQPREHCGHDRWTKFQLWTVLFLSIFIWPKSAVKHSFLGAESSNFAMNGPKNLSKSLYQKDRPFRAILDFAEKFQIFWILRLSNKFEDLKISSHFILLLNTSSKTICRKKNFGPISVEI